MDKQNKKKEGRENITISDLHSIEQDINKRSEKYKFFNKRSEVLSFIVITLFWAILFLLALLQGYRTQVLLFGVIYAIIVVALYKASYFDVPLMLYTHKDRITLALIKIASKTDEYDLNSSLNINSIEVINKELYPIIKQRIEESLLIYGGSGSIEKSNVHFLRVLNSYLYTNIKKIPTSNIENNKLFKDNIRKIAFLLYNNRIDEAIKVIGIDTPVDIPSGNKLAKFIFNRNFLSHSVTLILWLMLVIIVLKKYPVSDLSDLDIFLGIIGGFFVYNVYPRSKELLDRVIDFMLELLNPKEIN